MNAFVSRSNDLAPHVLLAPLLGLLLLAGRISAAAEPSRVRVLENIAYKSGATASDYERERCRIDLYLPEGQSGFATLVWFHGGGLKAGGRRSDGTERIARSLAAGGLSVAAVDYRLSPKVAFPAYLDDAAAAFAWVRRHIVEHGGSDAKVFIGGHSAGGYLAALVALDGRYLRAYALEGSAIAGVIPVSGQMITHSTVRQERGLTRNDIVVDEAAPLRHVRKTAPPFLVLYADNDMAARLEENRYFVVTMQAAGHERIADRLIRERTHGSIADEIANAGDPARTAILEFVAGGPRKP